MVALATQTPLIRVLPGPHAQAICVIMPAASGTGATVIACADVVTAKVKAAMAINLINCSCYVCKMKFFEALIYLRPEERRQAAVTFKLRHHRCSDGGRSTIELGLRPMSALGQKRTLINLHATFALPPKADFASFALD
jgi:hypothetical protein